MIGALALSACGGEDGGPELSGAVRDPRLEVGSIALPDVAHGGDEAAMTAAPGEILIVYFGYTSCPDICPTTMTDVKQAIDQLDDDEADRVQVAMATVDPDRDTDEVLTGYVDYFFEDPRALRTTDLDQLAEAATAFGVQYQVAEHEPGETNYEVAHTAVTYVVDDAGTVLVEWPFGLDKDLMASDLSILLDEES